MTSLNNRRTLSSTRESITHKFSINGHEGYLTLGLFDDGSVGEIFIKMAKEGSTLSGLIQGVLSGLQFVSAVWLAHFRSLQALRGHAI